MLSGKLKKMIAAMCIAVAAALLLVCCAFAGVGSYTQDSVDFEPAAAAAEPESTEKETETAKSETETDSGETMSVGGAVAGVAVDLENAEAMQETAEAEEETGEEEAEDAEDGENYFENRFLATVVTSALNVREEPDTESKWVGRLYANGGGEILEEEDGWTKISSGSVTGWVSNDYIVTGEAAQELAEENGLELVIEVDTEALKVRSEPTTEEDNKIRPIYEGETYTYVSEIPDWVEIEYSSGKTGWVSAEYVSIRYSYDYATTRSEIEAEEAAEKAAAEKAAAEKAAAKKSSSSSSSSKSSTTTRSSTSASVDDTTLLACLIQCEAGSYDGMLAVANVVINRVHSGSYPNSISGVIYQSGQFGPASNGQLTSRISKGPSSTALKAAKDALNGTNNIGSFMHFRSASGASTSSYSSYTIVAGNIFY